MASRFSRESFKAFVNNDVIPFYFAFSTLALIHTHVCTLTACVGPSMEPTIPTKGKIAFVWKLTDYKKGDVVISLCPVDPNKSELVRV